VFANDPTTVYYLPGTTGWTSPFGGATAEPEGTSLTFTNLHSFSVLPNGATPMAGLVQGSNGNFYGTTSGGGTNGGNYGSIFEVTTNGFATVLYEFTGGLDGASPQAGLVLNTNDGNFYGTTSQGGTNGEGTVFQITPSGAFTSLYSFTGGYDGGNPRAALAPASDGSLYGTTQNGGTNYYGSVFQITTNGQFSSIYAFGSVVQTNVAISTNGYTNVYPCVTNIYYTTNYYTNYAQLDGDTPNGLVLGLDGNLYGTTQDGGTNGEGTVFEMSLNGVLISSYSFTGGDGAYPQAGLVQGTDGNFYGTTANGGEYDAGVVFKFTTNGTLTPLDSFSYGDGEDPMAALVQGTDGSFYGTTEYGGTDGDGTVFQFTTNGTLANLYSFTNGIDGGSPEAVLAQGSDGNFYGTTTGKGAAIGYGTVFKIAPNGAFTAVYAFPGVNDGQGANGLMHGSDGNFYGTTQYGGTNYGYGSVFVITTNGTLTSLHSFNYSDGSDPQAALAQGSDGNFYGTTENGGEYEEGDVFQIMPNGTLTSLFSFTGGNEGANPIAALVQGGDGSFYGTTPSGGANDDGTIFKITTDGQFSTLYTFGSIELTNVTISTNGYTNVTPCETNIYFTTNYFTNYVALDGTTPNGLVMGFDGNLYGTAEYGGEYDDGCVFRITPNGAFTNLHSFTYGNDGAEPQAALVQGGDGNFYGSTTYGGINYYGTLFQVTPNGVLTTFYSFAGGTDGGDLGVALLAGTDGNFYGATQRGGTYYSGNIFQVTINGGFVNLYSFTDLSDGGHPQTALVQGSDGSLYGTTTSGAAGGYGDVFRLSGGNLPSPLPVITLQPANPLIALSGLPASFTVDALGGTPLSYQWKVNGAPLSDGGDISGVDTGTLTFDPVSAGDAGSFSAYSVVVSNSYGVTSSSLGFLTLIAPTNAMEDFEVGTNFVAEGDFALASQYFAGALSFSPTNGVYNFFYAATELLGLQEQPAGSNFLSRIGIGSAGRDVFNWEATKPTNANGHLEVPVTTPPLNADEFTAQLRTNVLPAIIVAESNLAQITDTSFTVDLTAAETHAGAVTVDWGDVQMLQAIGDAAELFIYTTYSWNLDVQLSTATNLLGKDGSIQDFLANYPSLLTTTNTGDLQAAKAAFTSAINEYLAASQFIRSRPPGETFLFNIDANRMQDELKFRQTLSNLLASLNGPVPLTSNPAYSVSAQAFFNGSFNLRSYLPEFQGNDFISDSFPDTTFGGTITGLTETQAGDDFTKYFHFKSVVEPASAVIFVHSTIGDPWGNDGDETAMTTVFGENWQTDYYETVSPDALFSPSTSFIFMDGSDTNADAMATFLDANLTAMETWVGNGGRLFLNAAPNQGGDINFGFGVTLIYNDEVFTTNAEAVNPSASIFNGPFTPVGTSWTGNWFAHGTISGTGLNSLINDSNDGLSVLAETSFGLGHVLFGGITLPEFHEPEPQGVNLLDNILSYAAGGVYPPSISITSPTNGASFTTNQSFTDSAIGLPAASIRTLTLFTNLNYSNSPVATVRLTNIISVVLSNLAPGSYQLSALATLTNGLIVTSAVVYVTINVPGTTLIDFDPLDATAGPVGEAGDTRLSDYLALYGVSVTTNSPGTAVVVENQNNATLDGFVIASSQPNLLTQIGSSGPVNFTVGFTSLLTQFSFTQPELVANPFVTYPAWQAQAFDAVGNLLAQVREPQISSSTNVPAQTYTLSGGGIASVEFSSEGTGLTTFNAMLLDDFMLTPGNQAIGGNLPPAVAITNLTDGEIVTSPEISIVAEAVAGSGTVTNVAFYIGNTLAGSAQTSPFSITTSPLTNGAYILTAVAANSSGLTSTSAPVTVTVASGFAFAVPPMSQTIGEGQSWNFTVTTTSNASFQWQFNGTNIPGATLPAYAVTNASLTNSGNYTVIASSDGQSITSAPAALTVLGPPTVSTISEVLTNGNFVLSVVVSDLLTNFYAKWLLNGNGIPGATNSYLAGTVTNYYTNIDAAYNSGNYEVVVANIVAATNSLPIAVNLGPTNVITTNNSIANSLTIDPLGGPPAWPVAGSNSSSSSGPSVIAGKPADGYLWYNWTPTNNGIIWLTTRGSTFDTLLGVYTNNGVEPSVAEDDDSGKYFTSLVSFNFRSNITYQIVVAGYNGATGNVVLELSPGTNASLPGPTNGYILTDELEPVITQQPSNQIVQAGATVLNSVTATGATNSTNYQWYFADDPVTGGNSNILVFNSESADGFDTNFLVISNFPASASGNYFVQVSNAIGVVSSAIVAVEIAEQSTNGAPTTLALDKFVDALSLAAGGSPSAQARYRPKDAGGDTGGFTLSQSFSTVGATKEEGEPNHAGQPGGASYWYSYIEYRNGSLQFDTAGSTFNTILAVYTSSGSPVSFNNLVNAGAAYTTNYTTQGQPSVLVSNATFTTYYIAIDGYQGASGSARLNVSFTPATNGSSGGGGGSAISLTNNQTLVAITSPANNYLTTDSTLTVKGTIGASGGSRLIATNVLVTVNTNAPVFATLGPANYTEVLVQVNGGVEEVAQETMGWSIKVPLTNGPNVITAQVTNQGFVSPPATRTFFRAASLPSPLDKAYLKLQTNGDGKITGQTNDAYLEVNKVYTVQAVPVGNWVFTNWTTMSETNTNILGSLPSLSFLMSTNLILQANFVTNPFTALAGVYNGLFSPPSGVTEANSGFLTATIPASSRGAYSARLLLDGGSYPFSGTFDLSLQAGKTMTRVGKPPLTVILQLTNDQMTGIVNDTITNSILQAYRAFDAKSDPATHYTGCYTLIIPPGSNAPAGAPGGYGYATLTNNPAGHVALNGRLGDGVAFSQSVPVATNGNIPLYASLYSRQGLLQGWLTLTTNNPAQSLLGTNLSWIKISSRSGLYTGGFTNTNITVLGSFYIPPQAGVEALTNLTNAKLIISNSNPADFLAYSNLTMVDNKLTASGTPPNLLEGVITRGTGVLTLTFRPTGADHDTVAKGVILQYNTATNATNAAGWFLDADQSGYFLLQQ
jgi:uncharacterized repeat protein (TIGR03803 family)